MAGQTAATGVPAAYGRACLNCARAKSRCTYDASSGEACERCDRMKKQCKPPTSVRKRNGRRTESSRTAQLENKLEDLVSLLKSQAEAGSIQFEDPESAGTGRSTPYSRTHSTSRSHRAMSPVDGAYISEASQEQFQSLYSIRNFLASRLESRRPLDPALSATKTAEAETSSGLDPRPLNDIPTIPVCSVQIGPVEAEENLLLFRKHMVSFCPFIYLPPSMTSRQLRQEMPFLWFCIMAIATRSLHKQQIMSVAMKQHIAQIMVVANSKSMDLLWGLLTYVAWTQYHRKERPDLTLVCCLVHSLVYDLVLNKAQAENPHIAFLKSHVNSEPNSQLSGASSMDSQRALLACYFITSVIAVNQRRLDSLNWTPHFDDCLNSISQQPEWLGDRALVAIVRYQLVLDQVTRTSRQSQDSSIPPAYLDALRSQIQNIKHQLPQELDHDDVLTGHYIHAELIINEASVRTAGLTNNPDFHRHQALDAVLGTVEKWFELFFSIPASRYIGISCDYWCQMAHCLVALFRLTVREDPVWPRETVRGKLDIFSVCEQLMCAFAEAANCSTSENKGEESGIFLKFHDIIRSLRDGWLAEAIPAANKSTAATDWDGDSPPGFVDTITAGPMAILVDQVDDAWLTDFFQVSWD